MGNYITQIGLADAPPATTGAPLIPSEKSIFIYAEAPPVGDNIPAPGLYRAAVPILRSITDHIAMIGIYSQNRHFGQESVHPELRPMTRSLPRLLTLLRTIRRRLKLPGHWEDPLIARLVGRWVLQSGATHILTLEGSDPESLSRVAAIARHTGLPFSVYMVDDFECTMRMTGSAPKKIAATKARMASTISQAAHVFAITDGLGRLLHRQFGIKAETLSLAYEARTAPAPPRKHQIFFLGSINFLYVDALRTLLNIVTELRESMGWDITVRFTYSGKTALSPLPDFVNAQAIPSAEILAQEISASLFAFLPYSFSDSVRDMVETSFPSKSLECMAYARSIVVYAPSYSTSARIFEGNNLPTVARTDDELKRVIVQHLESPPDHRARYREYLSIAHSESAVRETLLASLQETGHISSS